MIDAGEYGMSAGEQRDATRRRDVQRNGHWVTAFVEVDAWLDCLAQDLEEGEAENPIIWLSITNGNANLEDVERRRFIGGNRPAPQFETVFITASYLCGNPAVQRVLNAYAGVNCIQFADPRGNQGEQIAANQKRRNEETAKHAQQLYRKVERELARIQRKHRFRTRHAGALLFHDSAEPWVATPDTRIEEPPAFYCATCGKQIGWANKQWRHLDTGYAEAWGEQLPGSNLPGRLPRRKLDHLADPEEVGRQL